MFPQTLDDRMLQDVKTLTSSVLLIDSEQNTQSINNLKESNGCNVTIVEAKLNSNSLSKNRLEVS